MILARLAELLPLAVVLGTFLAALRHADGPTLRRRAVAQSGRILGWLVAGCALLQLALLFLQD